MLPPPDLQRTQLPYRNHHNMINFASNDYLGLSQHPDIQNAICQTVQQQGFGSTSSAIVSGYSQEIQHFEKKFSAFVNRERALLFPSGYHANIGVLTTIANRHNQIYADKLLHRSLLDGCRLSRAKITRYPHLDYAHLKHLLHKNTQNNTQNNTPSAKPLIISESLFSMEGDLASLPDLCHSTARLIIDDAHGIGILGKTGAGALEHFNLTNTHSDIPYLISPLGKAFAGMGAVVSGSHSDIEALLQSACTYHYTTALPPMIATGLSASLKCIQTDTWRREKLQDNIHHFKNKIHTISDFHSPIQSIQIPASHQDQPQNQNQKGLEIQAQLKKQFNILIACIRPPTVPTGTTRLRISLSAKHSHQEINLLIQCLKKHLTHL